MRKDELGHVLINYDEVRYDEDIQSVGPGPLVLVLRSVQWHSARVWWCPICKKWSVS